MGKTVKLHVPVRFLRVFLFAMLAIPLPFGLLPDGADASEALPVFGYIEPVLLYPGALPMEAKLDTGADNSALHALNIVQEVREGKHWVSFDVTTKTSATRRFERPLVRTARIKRRSDRSEERPIVLLEICLGTIKREVEVSLINRDNFDFRLLIGRSFLERRVLIDSGLTFSSTPNCS